MASSSSSNNTFPGVLQNILQQAGGALILPDADPQLIQGIMQAIMAWQKSKQQQAQGQAQASNPGGAGSMQPPGGAGMPSPQMGGGQGLPSNPMTGGGPSQGLASQLPNGDELRRMLGAGAGVS